MPEVTGPNDLIQCLKGKPAEFGCALAARIALRTAPLLRNVLHPHKTSRPGGVLLPAFHVLSALTVAGAWPERFQDLLQGTRNNARLAHEAMKEIQTGIQNTIDEAVELQMYDEDIHDFELEKATISIAASAMDVILGAVEAAREMLDHREELASDRTVMDSVVEVGRKAHRAIDAANGHREVHLSANADDGEDTASPPHIVEFWQAVHEDILLGAHIDEHGDLQTALKTMSASPLWIPDIPAWASRSWSTFRDELPSDDRWEVWTNWYQDRLRGRPSDLEQEVARLSIADDHTANDPEETNSSMAPSPESRQPVQGEEDVDGLDPTGGTWGDYPLDDLLIRHENRTIHDVIRRIDMSFYVMDPDFQRDFIWNEEKQSKLIESVIMRIPLPVFYMAEDEEGRMVVVDGLQRLSTFNRFIKDELRLKLPERGEIDSRRFSELPAKIQNRVEDCNLIFYIIDSKVPEGARLDIFERVNSGEPLTRQQMRNCLFMGPATRFLKDESRSDIFCKATGRSLNAKTMRDREFVNRFCAFSLLGTEGYHGDMDEFLAQCLRRMNKLEPAALLALSKDFRRGLANNLALFGKHSFRKHVPDQTSRSVLNASFWDVMSTELSQYEEGRVAAHAGIVRESVYDLLADEEFNKAISYGTNDTKQVRIRFDMTRQSLRETFDDLKD